MSDEIPTAVTGGDLNTLWRVARVQLPQVANAYNDPITVVHSVNGSTDEETFGRCFTWWSTVASQLEQAMFSTQTSLFSAQGALVRAIDAYTRVDGTSASELNKLGEEMNNIIESEGGFDDVVEREPPDITGGPNDTEPSDWSDLIDD